MTKFAETPAPMEVDTNSEKIDMSLDDIIELNKRENNSTTSAVNKAKQQQKRQWNSRPRNPTIKPGQGMQQNVQASGRPQRDAFGSRVGINRYWQTQARSPRIRPAGRRPPTTSKRQIAPIWKGNPRITPGRAQQSRKNFRPIRQGPPQVLKRRIMFQNRVSNQQKKQTQNQQRQTKSNIRRTSPQMGLGAGPKKKGTRMWQQWSSTNSILTISVPNLQTKQPPVQRLRRQQPLTGRKQMPRTSVKKQPKGVYLGFNFKSIANQTSLTLNDRFSSMKIIPRHAVSRRGGRTVTIG
ncbi:UAP56-interacting factor-like isoform X1 [Hemitrygon akajei]|uniref:UAP56-interacting factor-like isoform X1 n=1 Tax=Hemitrygon akajei TaxID=2704970 RepID=UPI003BF943BC